MDLINELESTIETRENIIEIRDIYHSFQGKALLKKVTLNIPRGRHVMITGLSGSGKTTLIKIIAGLIEPDQGNVIIEGVDISMISRSKLFEMRKRMSFMFQGGALLNNLTVFDNVALPLNYHMHLSKKEIEERVLSALDQFGMADFRGSMPGHLSMAQRKLIGVARALILEPSILFIDEPIGVMDAIIREQMVASLNTMRDNPSVTLVTVTHNIDYIKQHADYIAILHEGRIFAFGTRDEILKSRDPVLQRIMAIIVDETEMLAESVLGLMTGKEDEEL
jgi:phospholipid/cholesterol/gamma-HCH transport system ATP-binding protein